MQAHNINLILTIRSLSSPLPLNPYNFDCYDTLYLVGSNINCWMIVGQILKQNPNAGERRDTTKENIIETAFSVSFFFLERRNTDKI